MEVSNLKTRVCLLEQTQRQLKNDVNDIKESSMKCKEDTNYNQFEEKINKLNEKMQVSIKHLSLLEKRVEQCIIHSADVLNANLETSNRQASGLDQLEMESVVISNEAALDSGIK